jgi:hypothetical protein
LVGFAAVEVFKFGLEFGDFALVFEVGFLGVGVFEGEFL